MLNYDHEQRCPWSMLEVRQKCRRANRGCRQSLMTDTHDWHNDIFLWNVIPAHCTAKCLQHIHVKTCWLQNINLVEMLKLVKYLWTEIQNLDGILDGIGDFGRTENEILDSMFVQSLLVICFYRIRGITHYALISYRGLKTTSLALSVSSANVSMPDHC